MNSEMTTVQGDVHADCLWMQAGVIPKKRCFQEFNCAACRFDLALRHVCRQNRQMKRNGITPSGKKGRFIYWKDRLKQLPKAQQPCVHHMKGHIGFRACHRNYACTNCDFDQYFYDQYSVYTVVKPIAFSEIHGVILPSGYYVHPAHAWVKLENDAEVRIGLDDFAFRVLGCPDRIETPLLGSRISRNSDLITFHRGGKKAVFPSPVSGIVTAVNPGPRNPCGIAPKAPYTDGWIMMVLCDNLRHDLRHLKFMKEAEDQLTHDIERLYDLLEEKTGLMAADGGSLGHDIAGAAPSISWEVLVSLLSGKTAP